jgi:8-amino-7-oxononanoate synthase
MGKQAAFQLPEGVPIIACPWNSDRTHLDGFFRQKKSLSAILEALTFWRPAFKIGAPPMKDSPTAAVEEFISPDGLSDAQSTPFLMGSAPGPETVINGRTYLYFGGTGYFGLHGNAEMTRAGVEAFGQGTHSGTTRTGFGNNPALLDLERKLAEFFATEDAVSYVSGYFNGLFLAQGLAGAFDVAFLDETSHFCLRDGIAAAGKRAVPYKHRDPDDLRRRLKSELRKKERPAVMTDGVFPTFGEIAPLPGLIDEVEPYGGISCIDDAHGVGILGPNGRGTLDPFGLAPSERVVMAGTLSKAFGGHGGFIPGPASLVRRIRSGVGAYAGSSPTPTPVAAASAMGIDLVRAHPEWRETLRANVRRAKGGMKKLGFEMNDAPVPIVTWTLATAAEMKRVQKALLDKGIAIAYLKYVGAPSGGVLRATIFSTHTAAQIDRLLAELGRVL